MYLTIVILPILGSIVSGFFGAMWCRKSLLRLLKLSNTGNTLKLLVLRYNLKIVCRWINIPCTVISQKIVIEYPLPAPNLRLKNNPGVFFITLKETSIGNRGSKSTISNAYTPYKGTIEESIVVKEQRVDGSWQEKGGVAHRQGAVFLV
jgi:hypothetical protein